MAEIKDIELTNYDKALISATIINNPYIPLTPFRKQLEAIALCNRQNTNGMSDVLLGGGGAGSKTTSLSMLALQYAQVPNYRCLVARKNFAELIGNSSVFDNIVEWIDGMSGVMINRSSPVKIHFPSGARIDFKAFADERAKQTLKGSQYHRILVDEASEIVPEVLSFFYRSIRKPIGDKIPLSLILASNPLGPSNQLLIDNYVDNNAPRPFLPFTFRDNPYIDTAQYTEALMKLPKMDREAQLRGNFYYKPTYGFLIDEKDFDKQVIDKYTLDPMLNVVSVDLASEGADKTAITSLNLTESGTIELVDTLLIADSQVEDALLNFIKTQFDLFQTYVIVIEQEPGSSSTYASRYWKELIQAEFPFIQFNMIKPTKSKFERTRPSARLILNNKLFFVRDQNTEVLKEQFLYVNPDKAEMAKHPSPDLLDSLNQGITQMELLFKPSKQLTTSATTNTFTKIY